MADPDYMKQYRIETNENGYLTSTFSYSWDDLPEMISLAILYELCEQWSFLRYVLRYLQWDYGIRAIEFIHSLLHYITDYPTRFGLMIGMGIKDFERHLLRLKGIPSGWCEFYENIADFSIKKFGVHQNSAFETAVQVNLAVMPTTRRSFPQTITLIHDFNAYLREHITDSGESNRPLAYYGIGYFRSVSSFPANPSRDAPI